MSHMLSGNGEILEDYLSLRSISEGTADGYRCALISWEQHTSTLITALDEQSLKKWFTTARKYLSANTLEKYASTLRTIYEYTLIQQNIKKRLAHAQALELFDIIPFRDLRKTAKKDTGLKDKLVTSAEFQTLMQASNSVRMRALLAISYDSGCRKGELFNLKLRDIKIKSTHWEITVSGKTGVRTVPLTESIPYLRSWMDIHPTKQDDDSPLFVVSRKGVVKPMSDKSFNSGLKALVKSTGLRNIHPHMLRHTRLTELAEDTNIGDYQLKSYAGWTPNSNMASRYLHLTGRGHMNAILEAQGIDTNGSQVDVNSLLSLDKCPNCGISVDSSMVQCPNPACNHVLRSNSVLIEQNRIEELEAQVAQLSKALTKVMEKLEEGEE